MSLPSPLARLLGPVPEAILVVDGHGRILSVDDRSEALFGYAAGEMVGQPVELLLAARTGRHDAVDARRDIRRPRIRRTATAVDLAGRRKDGSEFSIDVRLSPLRGVTGRIIWAVRDASDRERAEQRLRALLKVSDTARVTLDQGTALRTLPRLAVPELSDWCILDVLGGDAGFRRAGIAYADPSRATLARRLSRFPPDGTRPHPMADVLRTGRPKLVREVSDAWLVAHVRNAEHLEILRALGPRSLLCVPLRARTRALGTLTFITAESGRRYGATDLAVAEELAARAALALDNARLYGEAREAIHLRDEFQARASHELRTPLTVVKGHLAFLAAGLEQAGVQAGLRDLVTVARRHADRAVQLLTDLIEASRLAAGRQPLELRPLDLTLVVADALAQVAPLAGESEMRLVTAVPPGLTFRGDRLKLAQVLVNLLTNAIKHSPPGAAIEVEGLAAGSELEVRVQDTGEGIAREHLERIFEPFRQVGQRAEVARAARKGAGLGLAIVKSVVELHGGRVWAESEGVGRGSTFVVRLPMKRAASRAA